MKIVLRIVAALVIAVLLFMVYASTKKGTYDVSRSQIVKAPAALAYQTVDDYRRWAEWGPWHETDTTIVPKYQEKHSGIGAGYSWTSAKGTGSIKTIAAEKDKSLHQEIIFDEKSKSDINWQFKDVDGGSEVTWGMKGELDLMAKVFFTLMGGPEKMFGPMLKKGLQNIDSLTQKAMEVHHFTDNGVVDAGGQKYVSLTAECSFDELGAKLDEVLPDVLMYCIKNGYKREGALFNLYHKYDETNKIVRFSCCIPVAETVKPEAKYEFGILEKGRYHKTTFQGHYKYSNEAWEKALGFAKAANLVVSETRKPFEVYTKGHTQSLNPADWITEIYLPID